MKDYSKWGLSIDEINEVIEDVQQLSDFDLHELKQVFNKFEKAVRGLSMAIHKFEQSYTSLPEAYISLIPVSRSIVLVDQAHIALADLPNVTIVHESQRLPKKGVHPANCIVLYLAHIYEQRTGRRPTVTVNPIDNEYTGEFVSFLQAVESDAELNMPSLARRAKELLKPNKQ